MTCLWFTYDLPMIYHDLPMIYPWFTNDLPMIYLWITYDLPLIYLWFTHDLPIICPWVTLNLPMIYHDLPRTLMVISLTALTKDHPGRSTCPPALGSTCPLCAGGPKVQWEAPFFGDLLQKSYKYYFMARNLFMDS